MTIGLTVVFDGNNGAGKSGCLSEVAKHLQAQGYEVITSAEPGGTRIGKSIRTLVRGVENTEMSDIAGMMLFAAARAQNVHEIIKPALRRGCLVLLDRFTASSIAFQSAGQGIPLDVVANIDAIARNGLEPDYTLIFDLDPRTGLARTGQRAVCDDKFELAGTEFLDRVRHDYLRQAAADQDRFEVIDASQSIAEVLASAIAAVDGFLERQGFKPKIIDKDSSL